MGPGGQKQDGDRGAVCLAREMQILGETGRKRSCWPSPPAPSDSPVSLGRGTLRVPRPRGLQGPPCRTGCSPFRTDPKDNYQQRPAPSFFPLLVRVDPKPTLSIRVTEGVPCVGVRVLPKPRTPTRSKPSTAQISVRDVVCRFQGNALPPPHSRVLSLILSKHAIQLAGAFRFKYRDWMKLMLKLCLTPWSEKRRKSDNALECGRKLRRALGPVRHSPQSQRRLDVASAFGVSSTGVPRHPFIFFFFFGN